MRPPPAEIHRLVGFLVGGPEGMSLLELDAGLVLLYGLNGAGKSRALDAVGRWFAGEPSDALALVQLSATQAPGFRQDGQVEWFTEWARRAGVEPDDDGLAERRQCGIGSRSVASAGSSRGMRTHLTSSDERPALESYLGRLAAFRVCTIRHSGWSPTTSVTQPAVGAAASRAPGPPRPPRWRDRPRLQPPTLPRSRWPRLLPGRPK